MVNKSQYYHLSIWCFAILIGSLFSQNKSIAGFIVDNETKKPIHGANVFSEKLNTGTSSKVDGSFILKNLSENELTIEISMIGYKKTNRSVALKSINNDIGTIHLDVDTLKFQELNVDAHSKIKPTSFSSNIDVIGEKYHKVLKSTLALTIQEQTGLSIRSMGQGTAQPVLRGYKGHRFLLTDDGIATGDLSSTSIDLSLIHI